MSPAKHHAEWLSLIEISGPFLSLPVLLHAFPQGLEARDTTQAGELRQAYADWQEENENPVWHRAWVQYVLTRLLGYPEGLLVEGQSLPPGLEAQVAEVGETLRPTAALLPPGEGPRKPALLIVAYPPTQRLDAPATGVFWKASPATRMTELLRATEVSLGLVTNGEEWMLVHAPPKETAGFASWYADLWMQEPLTLRAFHGLLGVQRVVGLAEKDTLAGLLRQSAQDQHEVTTQLGLQVRQAVEVIVQAFDRLDEGSGGTLLADVPHRTLYDAALSVMMRLVFLFCAEEKKLLLLGDPLYDQFYAVSTLRNQLRERADQQGEEVLERFQDAWCRLLATFRAVHAGVTHDRLKLPAYGGTLFDPDRFPFLEGRAAGTSWRDTPAQPIAVNNRVVLHLLEALQILRTRVPGSSETSARRLSFRALDIEQIGHVYEGLLDHTAKRASEMVLGLAGAKGLEPEIALSVLETAAGEGSDALIELLEEKTGRSASALRNALSPGGAKPRGRRRAPADDTPDLLLAGVREVAASPVAAAVPAASHALLAACGHDHALAARVAPFAGLVREDSFGRPVVILPDSVYVTSGTERRSTGTHYTPRSLTEPIVQYTLEPLVYTGPAEGKPKAEWLLKSPKELLALKVCDMAMGSGAFLVQACRYLSERLVEAWENVERAHPGSFVNTPEGELSTGSPGDRLIPADAGERLAIARRTVADRCLYGVDINPMAVEMAKLSLWLITLQRDRPFTFLDHALKCGDSLLGVSSVRQIENFSLRPGERQITFATANLFRYVEDAAAKRRTLEALPSDDHNQIEAKTRLHAEAETATGKVKAVADCLIAFELRGLDGKDYEDQRTYEAEKVQRLMERDADASLNAQTPTIEQLSTHAYERRRGRRPFHWSVEFPEVFTRGGFDAFVGNPPFMGGTKLEPVYGADYREYLVQYLANGVRGIRGAADLCAYFFRRAASVLGAESSCGLVATNTISQGDTRLVGLDWLLSSGFVVPRAIPSQSWPGAANLEIATIWLVRGDWKGTYHLNGNEVTGITADLTAPSSIYGDPFQLSANTDLAFEGAKTIGLGFLISAEEALELKRKDEKNGNVLYPYLIGQDLNSRPDQSPSRWTINFRDWPLNRDECPDGYSGPVASDYPDCLKVIEDRVKPERLSYPADSAWNRSIRARWWQYALWRPALHIAIRNLEQVLARSRVSNINSIAVAPASIVFSDATVVFAFEDMAVFAVLQSTIHTVWIEKYSSSMRNDVRYTPSSCFDTFSRPSLDENLRHVATRYNLHRNEIMAFRQEGLTKTYNRFHTHTEKAAEIGQLRELCVEMDQAVAAAYGWSDLDLNHGFHTTKQGERYTISESARLNVLDRLLALNHQRYAEEVAAGLHEKKKPKGKHQTANFSSGTVPQSELFQPPQPDLF